MCTFSSGFAIMVVRMLWNSNEENVMVTVTGLGPPDTAMMNLLTSLKVTVHVYFTEL